MRPSSKHDKSLNLGPERTYAGHDLHKSTKTVYMIPRPYLYAPSTLLLLYLSLSFNLPSLGHLLTLTFAFFFLSFFSHGIMQIFIGTNAPRETLTSYDR